MAINVFEGYIDNYSIDKDRCLITFFSKEQVVGTLKYVEGNFDFHKLSNIPKIYIENFGGDKDIVVGSILITTTHYPDDDDYKVQCKTIDGWKEIYDSSLKDLNIIVGGIETAKGFTPFIVNGVKLYNAKGEDTTTIDDVFFGWELDREYVSNQELIGEIISISLNNDDLYVCNIDGKIYKYVELINVMGVTENAKYELIDEDTVYANKDKFVYIANHIGYIDGDNIVFKRIDNGIIEDYKISIINKNVLSMRASFSTIYVYFDDGSSIERTGIVDSVYNVDTEFAFNSEYTYYDENAMIVCTSSTNSNITLESKISDSTAQLDFIEDIVEYKLNTKYNLYVLLKDDNDKNTLYKYDLRDNKEKEILALNDNDVFLPNDTVCKDGYMKVRDDRVQIDNVQTNGTLKFLPFVGSSYGIEATAGFAYCDTNNIMVQIEKGLDGSMSIIDTSLYGVFSLKNPYKLIELKYNAANGVAIYNNFIWIGFSDRILVKYDMYGNWVDEFNLIDELNAPIHDMASNCIQSRAEGLYIMTTAQTIYRFDEESFNNIQAIPRNSFSLETWTDRSSFAMIKTDEPWVSSIQVGEERIYGFFSDGTKNSLYKIMNDDVIRMESNDNILYTMTVYYPFELKSYKF